jgi:translation initiation factor 2B subunit (eIF-2B alpha/beta/delta family)
VLFMELREELNDLVAPIRDDLTSGAAEIALRAINVFQTMMSGTEQLTPDELRQRLIFTARALKDAQPAMAPLFHLGNTVLLAVREARSVEEIHLKADEALSGFERRLCETAAKIADLVFDLIPHGQLLFAYSFSSTVVSSLLNAKARGRFFRVVCTEARPSMEGRKLASTLASSGIEVINTFDCALGMVLSECRAAFMGVDCVGKPGVVNKVGSWMLAASCKELGIPLYALTGTEKFVTDERLFEFEKHERPGKEVWPDAPKGVQVLNQQYELIPLSMVTGIVTEQGILREPEVGRYVSRLEVHEALKLESGSVA